jgi:hypothetical protein
MDIAKTTNRVNCAGYDGNGVCDKWWYDANTHTTYTLQNMIGKQKYPLGHTEQLQLTSPKMIKTNITQN